jgi:phosphatidylserine decarboxylase
MKKLAILFQYVAPQRALSRLAGWLAECHWIWLKNYLIRYFINRYQVDINLAVLTSIDDYPTFNSFFTRHLKPELRPITQDAQIIISPADGAISQIGQIKQNTLLQAKGFNFSIASLLGSTENQAKQFYDGFFTTIYLAPKDYHRFHMPITGQLRETIFIPGQLFSVNQQTVGAVANLFARNERLVCIFDTAIGPMAVILVGAMLVGSIETVWGGISNSTKIVTQCFPATGAGSISVAQGAELGHFKMGSTVILLFPKEKIEWLPELHESSILNMGSSLGKICSS